MSSIIKFASVVGGPPITIGTMHCEVCGAADNEQTPLRHMSVMVANKVTLITVCHGNCAESVERRAKINTLEELKGGQ